MVCPYGFRGFRNPRAMRNKAVQSSHWTKLGERRKLFLDAKVKTELVYEPPSLSRTKDEKTGEVTQSLAGGPYIEVSPTLYYVSQKGNKLPVRKASLFTWTSKMACPSFSLAAGPGSYHGTCEASREEVVERAGEYLDYHEPLAGRPPDAKYICSLCYAGKNNYLIYPAITSSQIIRRIWIYQAIQQGAFVKEMKSALLLLRKEKVDKLLRSKKVYGEYFRIHDSGDFISGRYYKAWVDLCRVLEGEINFWAPTRLWVFEKWRKIFRQYPRPSNMSLRPSALFVTATPPQVPGMDAGTTSAPLPEGEGDLIERGWEDMEARWPGRGVLNCPAYMRDDSHSCVDANCRKCWDRATEVSYSTH